jgi:adenylyltransferase/sulfurtransferase
MAVLNYSRQSGAVTAGNLDIGVTVVGVGGIGSPVVLALAKMGVPKISVYDDDVVEDHNLPNQIYRIQDLGRPKVEAIKSICSEFSDTEIVANACKFSGANIKGILLSGVDTMLSRKNIWDRVRLNPDIMWYIDGRMGFEVCRIYTVRPCDRDDIRFYEKTLYSDSDAQELPCTARAIIYNVFVVSGLMANQVKRCVCAQPRSREVIFDLATLTCLNK